jgi:exonuclease III
VQYIKRKEQSLIMWIQYQCTQFHQTHTKDLKAHIDCHTVVLGDINALLSPIDRSSKKNQQRNPSAKWHQRSNEPTDIYIIFHPETAQYTFFSADHGTFSKTDHIFRHNASLSKYKKIEIFLCILSDHNALKLEIKNKRSSRKYANNWRLNNTLLNVQWVIE